MRFWSQYALQSCADMVRRGLLYLLAVCGCVIFYLEYQRWLAYFALLLLLLLPWLSLALSLPAIFRMRLEPWGAEALIVGDTASLGICTDTKLPVPPFGGRMRLYQTMTGTEWRYKAGQPLPTEHCGALEVTLYRCWVSDYMGLFRLPVRKTGRTVLVRPKPVEPENVPDLNRYLAQRWRPKLGGGFSENHELRLYHPGDGLNQVHWKLSAKTGKLVVREPMQPETGTLLVTMDLYGDAALLDRKFGNLLWIGQILLENRLDFVLRVWSGDGIDAWSIASAAQLQGAMDALLCSTPANEEKILNEEFAASWRYHIGGEANEA